MPRRVYLTCDIRKNTLTNMSQPSTAELARLQTLNHEVRETFDHRGYRIGRALDQDDSFRDGEGPRSTLGRAMMKRAVAAAAGLLNMNIVDGRGGSRTVQSFDGTVDRRYRVRSAKEQPDGTFLIEASSDAILQRDDDTMLREEIWVLGYTLTSDNEVDTLFVAEVRDYVPGSPGYLRIGTPVLLGATSVEPLSGFTPPREGLEGFDDDAEEEDTDAGS